MPLPCIAPPFLTPDVDETLNTSCYTFLGAKIFRKSTVSGTLRRVAESSYGVTTVAGNAASAPIRIEFMHYGTAFEIMWFAGNTTGAYRLFVDGVPIALRATTFATASVTNQYLMKFDFGSTMLRRITLETNIGGSFMGTITGPLDSILASPLAPGPRLVVGPGDSFVGGAAGVNALDTFSQTLGIMLGMRNSNSLGIGGTGYSANPSLFPNRINDTINLNPDIIVVPASVNDPGNNFFLAGDLGVAATTTWTGLRTGCPQALLVVTGILAPNGTNVTANQLAANSVLRSSAATAAAAGIVDLFVDAYPGATGDLRNWFTGTGKVGATTGNGNADLFLSNDGVHPSQAGSDYIAARIANAIVTYLRTV